MCVRVCVWGLVNAYVLFNASICFFFYYDGVAYHSLLPIVVVAVVAADKLYVSIKNNLQFQGTETS